MDPLAQQLFFWKLRYLTIYAHTCRRFLAVAFFAVAKHAKEPLCPSGITAYASCHKAVNRDLKQHAKGEKWGRPSVPVLLGSAPQRIWLRKKTQFRATFTSCRHLCPREKCLHFIHKISGNTHEKQRRQLWLGSGKEFVWPRDKGPGCGGQFPHYTLAYLFEPHQRGLYLQKQEQSLIF